MISEIGRVIKAVDGKAMVEIARGASCDKCETECALKSGQRTMLVEVNDPLGVHTNDYVQVALRTATALRASFVVYMIPVFALLIGALLGESLGSRYGMLNGLEILFSFGFLGLSLVGIRLYNNHFQRNRHNQPVITKVL